jgi:hypothetical protein
VILRDPAGNQLGSIEFPAYVLPAPQLPADPHRGALPAPAATVNGANRQPAAADLSLIVAPSPVPSLQCPYVAASTRPARPSS